MLSESIPIRSDSILSWLGPSPAIPKHQGNIWVLRSSIILFKFLFELIHQFLKKEKRWNEIKRRWADIRTYLLPLNYSHPERCIVLSLCTNFFSRPYLSTFFIKRKAIIDTKLMRSSGAWSTQEHKWLKKKKHWKNAYKHNDNANISKAKAFLFSQKKY